MKKRKKKKKESMVLDFADCIECIDKFKGNSALGDTIRESWEAIEQKNFQGLQRLYVDHFARFIELNIVGGLEDLEDSFPECGAIFKSNGKDRRIVGTCVLIGKKKLLTAKHVLASRRDYFVVLGSRNVRNFDFKNPPAGVEVHTVKDSQIDRLNDRDMAVLNLKNKSAFTPTVFIDEYKASPGTQILSVGFGCCDSSSTSYPWRTWGIRRMNCGRVLSKSSLDENDCLATSNNHEIHTLFCDKNNGDPGNSTGSCPEADSRLCEVDSGGALYTMIDDKRVLIGINDRTNDENGINTHTKIKKL